MTMTMDHRSFSARFRRNGRKGNAATATTTSTSTTPSPGQSPVSAAPTTAATTASNNDGTDRSPSANATTPPVLTITTSTTPPKSSHGVFRPLKSPSTFGKLHFHRSSNKRARSPAPATLPQPASPAVVNQDGVIDHGIMPSAKPISAATPTSMKGGRQHGTGYGDEIGTKGRQQQPKVPAFLNLSEQDIILKYNEITWNERNRVFQGNTNTSPTFKFARVDAAFRALDRYGNIQPWNNNRVKLQVPEGASNYINASPIILHSPLAPKERPPHKYIAMQGPTERTSEHVWRMVSEQLASPAVMVMLTETHENNMEKCFPYYPHAIGETINIGERDEFQDGWRAQVKCVDIEEKADGAIEMRKLLVQADGKEDMEVWHLLYKKWPDFGVPALEDINSFFELMSLSRDKNASEDNPRIVHCSAGVGRSGTFIALEHLMREIDSGDLEKYDEAQGDLVFETVNALREQRKMMVQAEPQYLFIYQVLRKQWMEKYGIVEDQSEPAAKRLEVETDPFVEDN